MKSLLKNNDYSLYFIGVAASVTEINRCAYAEARPVFSGARRS